MRIIKYVILLALIFCTNLSFAAQSTNDLYKMYCPSEPNYTSGGFSRVFQNITGLNFISKKIAEKEIREEILKFTQGKVKVKVKTFSATDTKNGIFKDVEIIGSKLNIYSIYISEFKAKNACDFIYLNLEKNPVELKAPMAIDFSAKLSENDLNNILKTTTYHKYLFNIKHNSKELKFIELQKPRISLKNNKFHYAINIKAPYIGTFIFNIKSDLKIKNNKIQISDMTVGTNSKVIDLEKSKYFVKIFNPLWFAQVVLQQHNCKVMLKNVKIENGNIITEGSVFLKKS